METEKQRIEELVKQLNAASAAYYNGQDEIMPNYEWDALFDELTTLEEKTGYIFRETRSHTYGRTFTDNPYFLRITSVYDGQYGRKDDMILAVLNRKGNYLLEFIQVYRSQFQRIPISPVRTILCKYGRCVRLAYQKQGMRLVLLP